MIDVKVGAPRHVVLCVDGHQYWYTPSQAEGFIRRIEQAITQVVRGTVQEVHADA